VTPSTDETPADDLPIREKVINNSVEYAAMYRVLLAVDESEARLSKQLDAIEAFPGRDELAVAVLYVYEEIDVPADEAGRSIIDSINEDIDELQGVPDTLSAADERLSSLGIETTVSTVRGDPAPAILDAAADVDADAVFVSARGRSPVGKAMFGSVAQQVILESDRPVVVAK
jgi:nucleotide-binding universal stress UspA family protein